MTARSPASSPASVVEPEVLELIARTYDCVLDPSLWEGLIEAMVSRYGMITCALGVNTMDRGRTKGTINARVGMPNLPDVLPDYDTSIVELWGGPERIFSLPLEEPVVQSDVRPANWQTNRYQAEILATYGISEGVGIGLSRDDALIGNITFGRHHSAGPVPDWVLAELRILGPHLRRAVTISGLLNRALSEARTFETALDVSPTPIVLCGADLEVVHANMRGAETLAAGDPLLVRDGRVALRAPLVPGQLEAAVEAARSDDVAGRRGLGIPARRLDGSPVLLHVLPLARREIRPGISQQAIAAVFVAETATDFTLPSEALALLYALTPAETRVAELLASGRSLPEIAGALGTSAHTVRTHLNRVFDKTGQHRQADLVRLLSSTRLG